MAVPDSTIPLKCCTVCGVCFPATLEYFHADKRHKDGLYSSCKGCTRERNRLWRSNNPTKQRASEQRYRASNRENRRAYGRQWRRDNRAARRVEKHKRRARLQAAEGAHTAADIATQFKRQRGRCYYGACGHCKLGDDYHIDHVIPLARGGSNSPENLVLTCPSCNLSKKDKLPHEWLEGGRLL